MTSVRQKIPAQPREAGVKRMAARWVILVVCSNKIMREDYAEIFERRQLRTGRVANCRAAIAAVASHNVRMVIIVSKREDHHANALISLLRTSCPHAVVWLIGNPLGPYVAESVKDHQVAVLPSATTPYTFERMALSGGVLSVGAVNAKTKRILRQRDTRRQENLENYARAKAEFEKRFLTRALECHAGNVSQTAKAVGVARRNLQWKIRALAIDIESTRGKDPENAAAD